MASRYTQGKGSAGGRAVDKTRCRAAVNRNPGGFYLPGQCTRKAVVDGEWCRQHSPAAEAERDAASRAKWNREMEAARREIRAKTLGHCVLRILGEDATVEDLEQALESAPVPEPEDS